MTEVVQIQNFVLCRMVLSSLGGSCCFVHSLKRKHRNGGLPSSLLKKFIQLGSKFVPLLGWRPSLLGVVPHHLFGSYITNYNRILMSVLSSMFDGSVVPTGLLARVEYVEQTS